MTYLNNYRIQLVANDDAEWMQLARKRLKMTQKTLATRIEVSVVTISRVEQGHIPMSRRVKERIERMLENISQED